MRSGFRKLPTMVNPPKILFMTTHPFIIDFAEDPALSQHATGNIILQVNLIHRNITGPGSAEFQVVGNTHSQ